MPVLRHDTTAAHRVPTGADPSQALERWLPPLWEEDPVHGVLTQRRGADLVLGGGNVYGQAPVTVGQGATVTVDPGHALTLQGNGQITIDGTLNAWGGSVAVLQTALGVGNAASPSGTPDGRSIWIGGDAVIDVAGRAVTARDVQGRAYGEVANGGTIEIGARHVDGAREVDAADAFVVVRPGARLDASGASAVVDVAGVGPINVASNGGVIALSSMRGLFVDGDLRAAAGGAGAAGGTLAINLETPSYLGVDRNTLKGAAVDDAVRVPRELVVAQVQGDSGLSDALRPGMRDAALRYGTARYRRGPCGGRWLRQPGAARQRPDQLRWRREPGHGPEPEPDRQRHRPGRTGCGRQRVSAWRRPICASPAPRAARAKTASCRTRCAAPRIPARRAARSVCRWWRTAPASWPMRSSSTSWAS